MKTSILLMTIFLSFNLLLTAQGLKHRSDLIFEKSDISYERNGRAPYEIRFTQNSGLTEESFFDAYKSYFELSDDYKFKLIQKTTDQLGQTHYRYSEYYKGIEIIGAQFILHKRNGYIHYANGHLIHGLDLNVTPIYTKEMALQSALNYIRAGSYMWENPLNEAFIKKEQEDQDATYFPEAQLSLTSGKKSLEAGNIKLAYRFDIYAEYPLSRNYVDVDAETGGIINVISRIKDSDVPGGGESLYNGFVLFTVDEVVPDSIYRLQEHTTRTAAIETYNMQNGSSYSDAIDYTSASAFAPWDSTGVNCHFGTEATFDYYLNEHGRNSLNDNGYPMRNYANANLIGLGWENNINAFWDGNKVTYGNGDGINYLPLVSLDVVGHEYTHGVTEFSANLIYQAESGALNESFSDIFGNLVEFMVEGNPGSGTGSWRMGEDFDVSGLGFRNMSDPNELGQPDTYEGNFWAPLDGADNGGVHRNSGVQNYWFYLLTEGGSGVNDDNYAYNVNGIGLTDGAKIAYRNLTVYLVPSSQHSDVRLASINSATDIFGENSQQVYSVSDAWAAVGVYYPDFQQSIGVSADTVLILAEFPQGRYSGELRIINLGLDTLVIDSIYSSVADFEIIEAPSLPCLLNEYQSSITIRIQYTANIQDEVTGILNIHSNDPNNPDKLVILMGNGFVINPVQEKTLYAASGGDNGVSILLLDKNSGNGTELGNSGFPEFNSLAINPLNDHLYGVTNYSSISNIIKINGTEGNAYPVLDMGLGYISLAFDTSGNLYSGIRNGNIYSINLEDGSYNLVTTTTIPINAISFNPYSNEMWAAPIYVIGDNRDKIYKINLSSGEASEIGKTGLNKITNDIAFDEFGMLYGIIGTDAETGRLIKIDTSNAAAVIIGETGFQNVKGLAYNPGTIVSTLSENNVLPRQYSLEQNFPNPFNPLTNIIYQLPEKSLVTLKIYNILGTEISTLVNEEKPAGIYELKWNAANLPSGVYFYQLNAGSYTNTKKMLLLK